MYICTYIGILHGHLIELSAVSAISVQWRYYMTDCYLHSLLSIDSKRSHDYSQQYNI